jgi:hypothetical protein
LTFREIAEITASIILSLGGGGGIVFALSSYLGKTWADRALENLRHEHAALNLELTHKLDLVTQQAKTLLQMRATEHQVRFAKLHEKRAEVIAELYALFVTAYWDLQRYHQWFTFEGGPTQDEQATSAWRSLSQAYIFFEKNRIYLSDSLSGTLDKFFERGKSLTFRVQFFESIPDKTPETTRLHLDARKQGLDALTTELPEMKQRLDAEFKKLLEPAEPPPATIPPVS